MDTLWNYCTDKVMNEAVLSSREQARASGQTDSDQGLQRLSVELEQWENRLDLQENLNQKEEWQ